MPAVSYARAFPLASHPVLMDPRLAFVVSGLRPPVELNLGCIIVIILKQVYLNSPKCLIFLPHASPNLYMYSLFLTLRFLGGIEAK